MGVRVTPRNSGFFSSLAHSHSTIRMEKALGFMFSYVRCHVFAMLLFTDSAILTVCPNGRERIP